MSGTRPSAGSTSGPTHPPRRHLLVPHTDRLMVKTNDRLADRTSTRCPGGGSWLGRRVPLQLALRRAQPRHERGPGGDPASTRVSSRMPSARTYSDVAHRVFTSPRDVVFREMEYAVPREAGLTDAREAGGDGGLGPAVTFPGRDPHDPRPTTSRCRPPGRLPLPGLPHPPRRRPPRLLRAHGADPARPRRAPLGQGAYAHRGRPSRRRTHASRSSSPCRDRLDPDRSSPTPTCAGSWATGRRVWRTCTPSPVEHALPDADSTCVQHASTIHDATPTGATCPPYPPERSSRARRATSTSSTSKIADWRSPARRRATRPEHAHTRQWRPPGRPGRGRQCRQIAAAASPGAQRPARRATRRGQVGVGAGDHDRDGEGRMP